MSKSSKLEKDLKKAGTRGVSTWQIIKKCLTTNPQKLVEILRKKYGYDRITDIWETKTKVIDGTKTVIKWKRYFWNESV